MLQTNFPLYILKIIRSFLRNRSFHVSVNGQVSDSKIIPFGVPQGAVLSPTLYNIFTADLVMLDDVQYFLFADDTGFIASHSDPLTIVNKLQAAQSAIEVYQKRWKITINAAKSQTIFFTRKRSQRNLPQRPITVCGQQITWSDNIRYLGVILDRKLTFSAHIKNTLSKCDRTVKLLYPLIKRRSHLATCSKLLLYKTVLRPVMTYGFPAWYDCAASHRRKIQIKQNRILKMMLNLDPCHSTEDVHEIANVEELNDWFERILPKFWNGCITSANPLLQRLAA